MLFLTNNYGFKKKKDSCNNYCSSSWAFVLKYGSLHTIFFRKTSEILAEWEIELSYKSWWNTGKPKCDTTSTLSSLAKVIYQLAVCVVIAKKQWLTSEMTCYKSIKTDSYRFFKLFLSFKIDQIIYCCRFYSLSFINLSLTHTYKHTMHPHLSKAPPLCDPCELKNVHVCISYSM